MEINNIESLPLFLRLGEFQIATKHKINNKNTLYSKTYMTSSYPKISFNKPIIF